MSVENDFDDLESRLRASILAPTRAAMSLPADMGFFRSLSQELSEDVDTCNLDLLSLLNGILESVERRQMKPRGKARTALTSLEDATDRFRFAIGDKIDELLEHTDTYLDEFSGKSAPLDQVAVIPKTTGSKKKRGLLNPDLQHAANIPKPQLSFRTPVDNSSDKPWHPLLKHKPNAMIPLEESFVLSPISGSSTSPPHPYQYEIANSSFPQHIFEMKEPRPLKSFEAVPFQWIFTQEGLDSLMSDLKDVTEIAVDLEHHDYRTFSGFLCLMQISTREKDYIIDTLILREELAVLNQVFTDPSIVKVFHGAESDIIWLQQNFGLYIVNLFDTYDATIVLGYPKHSLASLLLMYCGVEADKKYQLADWRIRPLPNEMMTYARSDTHYLLYIFDRLRNALLEGASDRRKMELVLERSKKTSLRIYSKEIYDAETGTGINGWALLLQKSSRLTSSQQEVLIALHQWRDTVARCDDESPRFVMSSNQLVELARQAPTNMASLHEVLIRPSAPLRSRLLQLLDVIQDAVKKGPVDRSGMVSSSKQSSPPPVALFRTVFLDGKLVQAVRGSAQLFEQSTVPSTPGIIAIESSLFANKTAYPSPSFLKQRKFVDIVEKIHSSIRTIPTVRAEEATIPEKIEMQTATAAQEIVEPDIKSPHSSQREPDLTTQLDGAEDIVVVGRTRKRKRKQKGVLNTPDGLDQPVTPFDYNSVPNLLDHGPEVAEDKKPKKQKKSSQGVGFGDFPAPPRNLSDMKGGNRTMTFR